MKLLSKKKKKKVSYCNISTPWLSGDVGFTLLCQVGGVVMWLNTLAALAAVPLLLEQLRGVVTVTVLSVATPAELWALSASLAPALIPWTAASFRWAAVWSPWVTFLIDLALWACRLGATAAFSSWAFDVASWEYRVVCQNLDRPKELFLKGFKEHLDNNHSRVAGTEAPPEAPPSWWEGFIAKVGFCRMPGLRKGAWLPALGFLRSGRGLRTRAATSQVAGDGGRKPVLGCI
jgi:hypothetical protein